MPDIKLGSLFDGIGVFPLAASRCGIRPVWASEIEKAPISITKRHFPEMEHLGDITKIDGGKIEPVHVITFGSPCQNLSLIGNRSGLAGAKSSLFYQAFRIIQEMRDATDHLYPVIIVWENVMGAFSTNDRMDFRAVLSAFADTEVPMPPAGRWAGAGMVRGGTPDVCWRLMDAQYWAGTRRLARRQRIFVVADFGGRRAADILFKPRPVLPLIFFGYLVLHGLESILGLGYNITIFWAISNINKTRIDMAVQWLPTAIIIFFAYMIIFGGVIGTIFKKRDIT